MSSLTVIPGLRDFYPEFLLSPLPSWTIANLVDLSGHSRVEEITFGREFWKIESEYYGDAVVYNLGDSNSYMPAHVS